MRVSISIRQNPYSLHPMRAFPASRFAVEAASEQNKASSGAFLSPPSRLRRRGNFVLTVCLRC